MSEPITKDASSIVSGKHEVLSVFDEGRVDVGHALLPAGIKAMMAAQGAFYTPQIATQLSVAPAQSANLTSIGGATNTFLQFELGSDIRIDRIDSVKVTLTLTNPSAVADCYVAPTPAIFQDVAIALGSAASDPIWVDYPVQSHVGVLKLMEREIALKILAEEGFQDVSSEDTSSITIVSPTQYLENDNPLLYPSIRIPPLGTREVSFYLLASPLTAPGFHLALLQGPQKMAIRFNISPGSVWLSAAGAANVSAAQLNFEGKRSSSIQARTMRNTWQQLDKAMVIGYHRPIVQNFNQGVFTPTFKNSFTLTNFVGAFSGLYFYLGSNAPATSTTPTAFTGSAAFFQDVSPRILNVDLATPLVTLTAGSNGSQYSVANFNLLRDGVVSNDSIALTQTQLTTMSMSATNNKSYLIRQTPGAYLYPFGADLNKDIWHQHGCSSGLQRCNGNVTLQFNTSQALTNTALYVTGFLYCELLYDKGRLRYIQS